MGKIVAIGGGEIGRPGTEVETLEIDREIIRLSGKQRPKLLFIPTATSDAESYCDVVREHFGGRLGCEVDILYLLGNKPTKKEIEEKVLGADIVYVGGGNTNKMLRAWRRYEVDGVLLKAYENGIVLSGLSAGAICWFRYGSNAGKGNNPGGSMTKIRGLGIIKALGCPHYNFQPEIKGHLKTLMSKTPGVAVALDDGAALECTNGKYRIITSKSTANAYKVYWKDGKYHEEIIEKSNVFLPMENLCRK